MIRFATIGTSSITERFLKGAQACVGLEYSAVYSRDFERAQKFANNYGVQKVYADLHELADDIEIDAVYIASPNSLHFEQAMLMLSHKKHVLCEKTIASNRHELKKMLSVAIENEVILLEAMRSVFDPEFLNIQQNIHKLGKIKKITFQYCQYSSRYDNFKKGIIENAFNPKFSNGALTDIGVYCVHPMVKLFGPPKDINADSVILENGVDGSGTIIASYDGIQAELIYSKICDNKIPSQIIGENGTMVIKEIANPYDVTVFYNDGTEEVLTQNECKCNLIYEIREWVRLIKEKVVDNPHNKFSLLSLEIMDEARRQTGIVFPADNVLV